MKPVNALISKVFSFLPAPIRGYAPVVILVLASTSLGALLTTYYFSALKFTAPYIASIVDGYYHEVPDDVRLSLRNEINARTQYADVFILSPESTDLIEKCLQPNE